MTKKMAVHSVLSCFVFLATCMGLTSAVWAQAGQINVGDLVIGTGANGVYQVWRNPGAGYQWIGNFSTADGATAGCQQDSTWRIYGAVTSSSGGFPERFAIASPHGVSTSAAPNSSGTDATSLAFDGNGHLYVGGTAGITQYMDSTLNGTSKPPQTLQPQLVAYRATKAPYVDVESDGTIVFTNGGSAVFHLASLGDAATPLIDTSTTNKPGTFYAVKVLPGSANIVVANGSNIERFDPAVSTSVPVMTYSVSGNPNFTVVGVDSNGTSIWGGDSSSGNFYRFNILTGSAETPTQSHKALNIATGGGGTLSGMCVLGASGAAQPTAAVQVMDATPSSPTVRFNVPATGVTTPNQFKATLVNLAQTVHVTLYTVDYNRQDLGTTGEGISDPATGTLSSSLRCALDSAPTGNPAQCEAYKIEMTPTCDALVTKGNTSQPTCAYIDLSILASAYTQPSLRTPPDLSTDPKFIGEMAEDETGWLSFLGSPDPLRTGGGASTVHSIQELTAAVDTNCGTPFLNITNGATINGNQNFAVQAAIPGFTCKDNQFDPNLQLELSQYYLPPDGSAPQKYGVTITSSSTSGAQGQPTPAGCYAGLPAGVPPSQLCDATFGLSSSNNSDTYNVGISTKGLPKGTWIYTVVDHAGHIQGGSVQVTIK